MSEVTDGLPFGRKFRSRGRTISEGEFALLHDLVWANSEVHANREAMKGTQFGERVLQGPCVLAITFGLMGTSGLAEELHQCGVRRFMMVGFEDVRVKAPLLPGDTLTAEGELVNARPSSKPGRGIARLKEVGTKQTGEVVIEYTRVAVFEREA